MAREALTQSNKDIFRPWDIIEVFRTGWGIESWWEILDEKDLQDTILSALRKHEEYNDWKKSRCCRKGQSIKFITEENILTVKKISENNIFFKDWDEVFVERGTWEIESWWKVYTNNWLNPALIKWAETYGQKLKPLDIVCVKWKITKIISYLKLQETQIKATEVNTQHRWFVNHLRRQMNDRISIKLWNNLYGKSIIIFGNTKKFKFL